MKKLTILGLIGIALSFSTIQAQSIDDNALGYYEYANKFSQIGFGGSARMQAMAGAQTALGGDIGTLTKNPAGLGVYRKSDLSISGGLLFNSTNSAYTSPTETTFTKNNKDNFNIPSFGVVFANSNDSEYGGDWKSEGIGVSFNRLNNFHNRFSYEGQNNENSFRDFLVDQYGHLSFNDVSTTDQSPDDLFSAAYYTFLLNQYDATGAENASVPFWTFSQGERIKQEEEITISGAQNQWDFGYGANYQDKLYLGASIGIMSLHHKITRSYKETLLDLREVDQIEYNTFEETNGTGFNFKIGTIYKANDIVRLAVSLETPTYYSLKEEFNSDLSAAFNNVLIEGTSDTVIVPNSNSESTTTLENKYNLRTPYRVNGGLALFAGKNGFITADLEYVFYNRARLSADGFNFTADNKTIRNIYKAAANIRIGGEYRVDNFRLRGGYAYYGNSLEENVSSVGNARSYITGGIGLKLASYSFDVAVVYSNYESGFSPYTLSDGTQPTVITDNSNLGITFTYGVRF